MNSSSTIAPGDCPARYALNQTDIEPIPIYERLAAHVQLQLFLPGTLILVRVVMITWLTIGIFGNSLSLCIWMTKHQRRKSPSAIYLAALACADFCLILCLTSYHVERYWGLNGMSSVNGLCQIYQCVSLFTQFYSTSLVFGFTLERYLSVCFPFKRHKLCSPRRAVMAIVILLFICLIPTIFQAVLWTFENGQCRMRMEWTQDNRVTMILLYQEVIFSIIVPCGALVFNILVLREMRRLVRSRATTNTSVSPRRQSQKKLKFSFKGKKSNSFQEPVLATTDNTAEVKSQQESSSFIATTIMLVILSFYLIICAVPPGVMYVLQFKFPEGDVCMTVEAALKDETYRKMFASMQVKEIIDLLCASHYALNVVIYLLTSRSFREHALWIISCNIGKLKSLTRPTTDNWSFHRRTAPRHLSSMNNTRSESDETNTLVIDESKNTHRHENGNG